MASKVHPIVEDSHDFNRAGPHSIHQEMTCVSAAPCDMERPKAGHDVVPRRRARNVRANREVADRVDESVPVETRLLRAEILDSPFEDVGEIDLCGGTETNSPFSLSHQGALSGCPVDNLLGEIIQIGLQLVDVSELLEFPSIQRAGTGARKGPQRFQPALILCLSLFHEPQPVAQHFAGILVATGLDQRFEEFRLTLGQYDVPGGHLSSSRAVRKPIWHNMPSGFRASTLMRRAQFMPIGSPPPTR